jgi:hypothetical protein
MELKALVKRLNGGAESDFAFGKTGGIQCFRYETLETEVVVR